MPWWGWLVLIGLVLCLIAYILLVTSFMDLCVWAWAEFRNRKSPRDNDPEGS
jgi:hypothetical protein